MLLGDNTHPELAAPYIFDPADLLKKPSMYKRVPFRVIHVSGEEKDYKGKELNCHGPSVKGWHSPQFCLYPQEMVMQLDNRTCVRKIQILSHQHLIATRIDVYVGDVPPGKDLNLSHCKFSHLGYVTLSDNEASGFKARELKSVSLEATGTFIKLILQKNHMNRLNIYNQVSVIAVNVLGEDPAQEASSPSLRDEGPSGFLIAPYDELAFNMYTDQEVVGLMRSLEQRKEDAVTAERFEYANKLKSAIVELRAAGLALGKLEMEKRAAIDLENFDKAKLKKQQMDEYRTKVYEALDINGLLEPNGRLPKNDIASERKELPPPTRFKQKPKSPSPPPSPPPDPIPLPKSPLPPPRSPPRKRDTSPFTSPSPPPRKPRSPVRHASPPLAPMSPPTPNIPFVNSQSVQLEAPTPPASDYLPNGRNAYQEYEERTLPALRRRPSPPENQEIRSSPSSPQDYPSSGKKSNVPDQHLKKMNLPMQVFGKSLVNDMYSKNFSDKERALKQVKKDLAIYNPQESNHSPGHMIRAAAVLLERGLKDKVYSVYCLAVQVLLHALFDDFMSKHKVPKQEIVATVDRTLPELLVKAGDTAPRVSSLAVDTVLKMADYPMVKKQFAVPLHLTKAFQGNVHAKQAQARTEMVESVIDKFGISKNKESGMNMGSLMAFASSGLQQAAEPVRKSAERIYIRLYKENRRIVRKYLPPDDDKTRKNLAYRHLFEEFDKIDAEKEKEAEKQTPVETPESPPDSMEKGKVLMRVNSHSTLDPPNNTKVSTRTSTGSTVVEERTCIFCGEEDNSFNNEGLDMHYWKSCKMLTKCPNCKQVVEVSGLSEHLLDECEYANAYRKCKRCGEAIIKKDYDEHVKGNKCENMVALSIGNHCPLCHKTIAPYEQGWRRHLMGPNPCPAHSRSSKAKKERKGVGETQNRRRLRP